MDESIPTGVSKKERRALRQELKQKQQSTSSTKSGLLWGGAIIAVVLAVIWLVRGGTPPKDQTTSELVGQEVVEGEWVKGATESAVTLIEYSDLQCPACASYQPMIKDLLETVPDIRFVYRHFPLTQIHPNAQLAAQAAEAAGIQGKFWEMHDILFEKQKNWAVENDPMSIFLGYANDLKLDIEKFKSDLNSDEVKKAVDEDIRAGMQARVNSTPSFILNNKKIVNPRSLEEFKQLIEAARQ